ncbi:MAG TPA: restriction endonuclease [Candidatus Binataceae bacterium]|nr:restriction endonuclease [Candidatus Binataceae bacterium]
MEEWDGLWNSHLEKQAKLQARAEKAKEKGDKKAEADERTREAQDALTEADEILTRGLKPFAEVWDSIKDKSDYTRPKPRRPREPTPPAKPEIPAEPLESEGQFRPKIGVLGLVLKSVRTARAAAAHESFLLAHNGWKERVHSVRVEYETSLQAHAASVQQLRSKFDADDTAWQNGRNEFLSARDERNAGLEQNRQAYSRGEPEAVRTYFAQLLSASVYPEWCTHSFELEYKPETGIVIAEFELPPSDRIPTLQEVRYLAGRDEHSEKHLSSGVADKLYDRVIYQIALRTLHEIFAADTAKKVSSIVFNGYVNTIDAATGQQITPCILSLQASATEFGEINLKDADLIACFRRLRGVAAAKLSSTTPIAPILKMSREDPRFIEGKAVIDGVDAGQNLAVMDWEDFEFLIRELFEQEFSVADGEVKVTRASRDGGVDAVIFDPDPIRGGKIVVQAKRYAHTVGVSAVRDLYGTLINEGANKGILISTADYGPDAYAFAKGKPLVLLSGGNLLSLLQKHGHKARIDLAEARKILAEKEREQAQ